MSLSNCPLRAEGSPQTQTLSGEVLNAQGSPIPEATCTLTGQLLPQEGVAQTTGRKGDFHFPGLTPGAYLLLCAAPRYTPLKKRLEITDLAPPFLQVVLPDEIRLRQHLEVREKAPTIAQQQAAPAASLTAPQILDLPLVEQKFTAALPLIPGVVRTPNGKINIKGLEESQGLELVDSAQASDPVTGSFAIGVPKIAIESIQVYKDPDNAQFGGFSGGLASVGTRPPTSRWGYEVQNLTPNPRIKSGQLVGIADYNPEVYFTGPLITDRLNFSEAFAYDIDKQPVRGLAWPHNEIKIQDLNSLTSFQYVFSPQHLLTTSLNIFPLRREFANINSLVQQPASSNYGQKGFSVGATDRFMLASGGVLLSMAQVTVFDSYAHGQGPLDMLLTPEGWGGNFFNAYDRESHQVELLETFRFPQRNWHGKHDIEVGGTLLRRDFAGSSHSRPVVVQREDGTVAERIDFLGAGDLQAKDYEVAVFAQDQWALNDQLAFHAGLRYTAQTLGDAVNMAPRVGLVYSPEHSGRTVLRAGFGAFYEHAPLLGGDFVHNPTRVVTYFNEQQEPLGPPLVFPNAYYGVDGNGVVTPSSRNLNNTPANYTLSLEADRELRPNTVFRLSYLLSQSHHQFIVNPFVSANFGPALLLSDQGSSRYHEFEATLHFRGRESSEWTVSYVQSGAQGDLNTLAQIFVPFEQPVIRPNGYARLPWDVPHRLIAWGRFKTHLWGITAGPFLDFHSGFPYSDVDVLQNYVGEPNARRFPRFFSIDLKLGKEFRLPFPWVKQHLMRGELTIFNLTNYDNPRDVINNLASPMFGHYLGFQHQFFDSSLDIVY